jgi:DNA-binding Lrp family transcriptional regulator
LGKIGDNEVIQILSFMTLEIGQTENVLNALKEIPQIKEIFYITGEFDLAIVIEANSNDEIHELFMKKIDKLDGIEVSTSHLIMKRIKTDSC